MTCCRPRWGGRTATCTNSPLASDASVGPTLKTGSWECLLWKASALCVLTGYWAGLGSKAIYTYDFGDSWEHSLVLERRLNVDPNTAYPVCRDGQLACPPEDCGGIPGFYDLIEALSDPNHEPHEEMLDWIGEFDPQAFSLETVNRMLTPLRRRRDTSRGWAPAR